MMSYRKIGVLKMKKALFVALLAASLSISPALAGSFVGKDATGATKYFKSEGTGTSGDPYVPHHTVTDGTTVAGVGTAGADAGSNTSSRLLTGAWGYGYNGTTWDRIRAGITGVQTTPTGFLNGLPFAKYNSAAPTLSDGDFSILQLTSSGSLKVSASQSGTWTMQPGNTANTTPWLMTVHDGTTAASVRNLAANDALNVAIVDGSGSQITSFGGGTQYTEADTDATIVGTALLWEDTGDTLRAASAAKPLPVNVISGSAAGTEYTEDAAAAADPAGPMSMAVRADTPAAVTSADGDNIALRATNKGELYVKQTDAVPVTDNGGSLTVDGAVTVTNAGTFATQVDGAALTALQLLDDVVATDGAATPTKGNLIAGQDGTNAQTIKTDTSGELQVDVLTIPNVTIGAALPAGTNAIGKLAANDGVDIGDVTITNASIPVTDNGGSLTVDGTVTASNAAGDVAHDAADSGNPVKIGVVAKSSDPTAVATGDRVNLYADLNGKLIVLPYSLPENTITGSTAAITDTTSTSVIAAAGAGIRNYVTTIIVTNSHASVGTLVTITDGSGGSTLAKGYAKENGGGWALTLPVPVKTTANTALHAVCGTTGANVYVTAIGYKAP
jgi:hypothetical protein